MSDPLVQVVNSSGLGEGPHWDADKQELLYVDIEGTSVHRYVPSTGEHTQVTLGGPWSGVSLVVPVSGKSGQYIVSKGRDLNVMEWDGKSSTPTSLTSFISVEPSLPSNRFNDGKVDSMGRLWAGTITGSDKYDAAFYKINKGVITTMATEIHTSNGLAWNSANTQMYYNDTATGRVDVFDYNSTAGTITNRRTVYDFGIAGEKGAPDGMTIDASGNLWVGCWGGNQIIQINPSTGQKVRSVPMPTSNITSAAFGGPNLDILYVTSARVGLSDIDLSGQPAAGTLFQITNLGVKGQSGGNNYITGS